MSYMYVNQEKNIQQIRYYTVKTRFTWPLRGRNKAGKSKGTVNQGAIHIGLHINLDFEEKEAWSIEGLGRLGHGQSGFYCNMERETTIYNITNLFWSE